MDGHDEGRAELIVTRTTNQHARDAGAELADALWIKHGNYVSALLDVCESFVEIYGVEITRDLIGLVVTEAEEEASKR